ncbi:acetoacetate decarboxylase family protein [Kocuria sp.]|uniref:acetoacetate decarboxylase family protein n=1 Tax=Kocuria sp. TaxID=1871328 RepID=UPI0026DB42FC|nr:acetoacetate decarboxylase family protein [Kocuria sp.]MDO4918138.1 acetoacetate decarboxylase family protein [Kocuria sp.]
MTAHQDDTVNIALGDRTVTVPRGGLYDRYRMQTDLDVVAQDSRVPGVDFFRDQPKTEVASRIGTTWTPNFYYAMSSARLSMLAPTRALRRRLPGELDPLEIAPGFGLASLMLFRYDVADIDFYTEAAVGIAVKPPRHGRFGAVDTLAALKNNHLHAYVLSLPVNTEIAQVRGHDGYGFPKWVAPIDVTVDEQRTAARIGAEDGGTDLELSAPTPGQKRHPSGTRVSSLTSYTQVEGAWHSTFNQTNVLATGTRVLPKDVRLSLGRGRVSDDIRSLRPVRTLSFDATTSAQAALHMPTVISV